jgi:hypothetical protein
MKNPSKRNNGFFAPTKNVGAQNDRYYIFCLFNVIGIKI